MASYARILQSKFVFLFTFDYEGEEACSTDCCVKKYSLESSILAKSAAYCYTQISIDFIGGLVKIPVISIDQKALNVTAMSRPCFASLFTKMNIESETVFCIQMF